MTTFILIFLAVLIAFFIAILALAIIEAANNAQFHKDFPKIPRKLRTPNNARRDPEDAPW